MRVMKQLLVWCFLIFAGSGIILSCYPGGAEFVDELDVVATQLDTDHSFRVGTYKMPDSVVHINDTLDPDNDPTDGRFDNQMLVRVALNLDTLGYTRLADTSTQIPDIFVTVSTLETTNVGVACLPPYWWGGWGWWGGWPGYGPGWGPGYPGGCAPAYAYSTGTIIIQMYYPEGATNQRIPIVWNAAVNGLLQGSESGLSSRINRTIDQAFEQSPYLSGN